MWAGNTAVRWPRQLTPCILTKRKYREATFGNIVCHFPLCLIIPRWKNAKHVPNNCSHVFPLGYPTDCFVILYLCNLMKMHCQMKPKARQLWNITPNFLCSLFHQRRVQQNEMPRISFGIRLNTTSAMVILAWKLSLLRDRPELGIHHRLFSLPVFFARLCCSPINTCRKICTVRRNTHWNAPVSF